MNFFKEVKARSTLGAKLLFTLSVLLFVCGAALIIIAKREQVFTYALIGATAWGLSVFSVLLGFLNLKGEVIPDADS